jgi:hypothetical protein
VPALSKLSQLWQFSNSRFLGERIIVRHFRNLFFACISVTAKYDGFTFLG